LRDGRDGGARYLALLVVAASFGNGLLTRVPARRARPGVHLPRLRSRLIGASK
jgi:hypothetical protein